MPVIETMTFRLASGADVAGFLAADAALQQEFAYHQPGLLRRTTARGLADRSAEWIVVDLWDSEDDAEACGDRWPHDPAVRAFLSFVDEATIEVRRYTTLD